MCPTFYSCVDNNTDGARQDSSITIHVHDRYIVLVNSFHRSDTRDWLRSGCNSLRMMRGRRL